MIIKTLAAVPLIAMTLLPAQARTAPQILGLIASAEPVPMTCVNGSCRAELSSICLQQHRNTPHRGTVYRPAEGTRITLTVTGRDGMKRRRPVAAALRFVSLREYAAVEVSLPEAVVRQMGEGTATLSVEPMASIIPVALEADPKPLSTREIKRYTGPLRAIAESTFKRDDARINATRVLNQMINRLPRLGHVGIERMGSLWKQVVGKEAAAPGRKFLKRAMKDCRETLRTGVHADLRSCLGYQHDYLSGEITNNVWKAMKPAS